VRNLARRQAVRYLHPGDHILTLISFYVALYLQGLNWATGMSRWMAKKDKDDEIMGDPDLVSWIENQRHEYWRWKQGRKTAMEQDAFDMLGNFGFDWGDEADYQGGVVDEEGGGEVSDLDTKPKARHKGTRKDPEPKEEDEDEENKPRKVARTTRRSKRAKTAPDFYASNIKAEAASEDEASSEEDEASYKDSGRSRRSKYKKSPTKAAAPKEAGELRSMIRIVPIEDNDKLVEQVKEEFKELLVCAEPLEVNKEKKVLHQDVVFNKSFEEKFFEMLVFKKAYGHTFIPKVFPENPALGRWTGKVRHWKTTKDSHLTTSRQSRLTQAGFIWDPKSEVEFWKLQSDCVQANELWEENFQDLLKYKEANGNCLVPKEYQVNKRLARWVLKQRRSYKAKEAGEYSPLDDEKIQRLLDVGFVFNSRTPEIMRQNVFDRFRDRWNENLEALRAFKATYGHTAVPRRFDVNPSLSSWAMRQVKLAE
jgi:hypothetical protein